MLDDLTVWKGHEVSTELRAGIEKAEALMAASKSKRTRQEYQYWFSRFVEWCATHKARPLPAAPGTLVAFMGSLSATGCSPATLNLVRSAVKHAHDSASHDFDHKHKAIRELLSGARRQHDTKQARPFTLDMFRALAFSDSLEDVRDKAMLAIGLARALRGPSELIALDLDEKGSRDARGFLEIGKAGATVHLVRSKASQTKRKTRFIERGLAVEAVEAWIKAAKISSGSPLWRVVRSDYAEQHRMSARTWDRVVKRRAAQALASLGMSEPDAAKASAEYSTHSIRAGIITSLDEDGATIAEIVDVTGHSPNSANVVLGYTRRQDGGAKRVKKLGL